MTLFARSNSRADSPNRLVLARFEPFSPGVTGAKAADPDEVDRELEGRPCPLNCPNTAMAAVAVLWLLWLLKDIRDDGRELILRLFPA